MFRLQGFRSHRQPVRLHSVFRTSFAVPHIKKEGFVRIDVAGKKESDHFGINSKDQFMHVILQQINDNVSSTLLFNDARYDNTQIHHFKSIVEMHFLFIENRVP